MRISRANRSGEYSLSTILHFSFQHFQRLEFFIFLVDNFFVFIIKFNFNYNRFINFFFPIPVIFFWHGYLIISFPNLWMWFCSLVDRFTLLLVIWFLPLNIFEFLSCISILFFYFYLFYFILFTLSICSSNIFQFCKIFIFLAWNLL